ncbi:hypothetical protein FRC10_007893, partial [Ceratobasidium sp. 414]
MVHPSCPYLPPQTAVNEAKLTPIHGTTLHHKKDADTQAAFHLYPANYIAHIEETVTHLRCVIRELQDSFHKASDITEETKQSTINSMRWAE